MVERQNASGEQMSVTLLQPELVARAVIIDYTNHRGERSERRIRPGGMWYGVTEWHHDPQWLVDAIDLDKSESRTFAMKDIHSWRPDDGTERT